MNKFNSFLILALSFVIVSLLLSFALVNLGDNAIVKDQIGMGEKVYKVAKLLNPLNRNINTRLMIAKTIKEERKGESEETDFDNKVISFGANGPALSEANGQKAVLGVSINVPVLMYHYIRINPWPEDKVGFNLSVTPNNFKSQMEYLSSHNYHTISLDELGDAMLHGKKLPGKPIVITLDDGYRDSYTAAYPILKAHGLKAVDFVITGFVGGPNYLTWQQILEMKNSGVFTFGSHTVSHIALTYATDLRIKEELENSKNDLQAHLGYPVNWFAYPYGNVNKKVESLVPKSGYLGAFGTNNGTYHSKDAMFTLPRVRIGGGDTPATFVQKLP